MANLTKYTLEDKLRAAFAYIITGNSVEASAICGIPDRTLREWTETTWWPELISEAKTKKNGELDAMYTRVIEKALKGVEDRVDFGDEVLDKFGQPIRKAVSGRDLAIIAATFQDKRAIIRGEPTSITKRVKESERLNQIANGLEELDKREEATKESNLH